MFSSLNASVADKSLHKFIQFESESLSCSAASALQADILPSEPPGKSQEYWSELLFSSPGYLSNPGNESVSPALQADSLQSKLMDLKILTLSQVSKDANLCMLEIV